MTGCLGKNLEYINNYNPVLCKRILDLNEYTNEYNLIQNENGEYNLSINGTPVHSLNGAENEAINIFQSLSHNTKTSIHVIYGLGLGYLYDVIANNTSSTIIVYEPNIEILRFVMEVVDFTQSFKKTRTFIATNNLEFETIFKSIFRYKSKVTLSVLDYHKNNQSTTYTAFSEILHKSYGMISHNYNMQINNSYDFFKHTIIDLKLKIDAQLLHNYENCLKDTPAIIASAGPSLAKNIETLNKYKDNAMIFSVSTGLMTLINNDITPDFLSIIERYNSNIHYKTDKTKDIMVLTDVFTNSNVLKQDFKRKFVTASQETHAARWFLEKINKPIIDFETKGTVAYHALFCAKFLGCNPIILVGQDLAYPDGNCYAKGSKFEDLKCIFDDNTQSYKIVPENIENFKNAYFNTQKDKCSEENIENRLKITLENFNKNLVTVNGQNGEKLPTSAIYSLFIEYLKDFGLKNNDKIKLINSSIGGAQIDGYDLMPLEDALEKFASKKINKKELLKPLENVENNDKNKIKKHLLEDINYIKHLNEYFMKGLKHATKLEKELRAIKSCTPKANELLEKMSNIYVDVTNNYANKSNIFGIICMKERSEIDYLMKHFNGNMTYEKAKEFSDEFLKYFKNISEKIEFVTEELNKCIKEIEKE